MDNTTKLWMKRHLDLIMRDHGIVTRKMQLMRTFAGLFNSRSEMLRLTTWQLADAIRSRLDSA